MSSPHKRRPVQMSLKVFLTTTWEHRQHNRACYFLVIGWYMKLSHEADDTMPETGLSMEVDALVFASISPLYSTVSCQNEPSLIMKQASLGNSELPLYNNGRWQLFS